MDFKSISEALANGEVVRRKAFPIEEVVFLQIPADIKEDIVPKMTSLSKRVKEFILATAEHIAYHDQCIKYNMNTGAATYYNPTIEDVYATDWMVVID